MSLQPPTAYSPGDVIVVFKGQPLSGYGDDIFSAKRTSKLWTQSVGADGEVVHVKSADRTGEAKITAKQTSRINAILGAIVQADQLAGGGLGELMLVDPYSGSTIWSSAARLDGYPEEIKRGKEATDQVWTLLIADLEFEFTVAPPAL